MRVNLDDLGATLLRVQFFKKNKTAPFGVNWTEVTQAQNDFVNCFSATSLISKLSNLFSD